MGVAEKIQQAKIERIKRQKRRDRITLLILLSALLSMCVGLFFGFKVIKEYMDEQRAERNLENVRESMDGGMALLPDGADDRIRKLLADQNVVAESTEDPIEVSEEYLARLQRRVDFDSLLAINPDADSWLWIPDTNVDYYVMHEQKTDVYEYLWKDIYHQSNGTGSLLRVHVPADQDDAHLLIFGHRMSRRDLMFANLVDWRDEEFAKTHQYVMMYYPDHSECWKVWTASNVQGTSDVYKVPFELGSQKYQNLLDYTAQLGSYQLVPQPNKNTRTLYLSTCDKAMGNQDTRFIVVCVPDIFYYYDTQTLSRGPLVVEEEW